MASVKAPLFSLSASGTIGKSIVYSNWKGIDYVRRHAIPSNPKEPTQLSVRAILKALSQAWSGIGSTPQASWDSYVTGKAESPFNGFIGYNCARWRNGLMSAKTYPFGGAGTTPSAPTTTVTGGVRQVSLSIADGANAPDFWLIHKGSTGFTPSWANVIAVVPRSATPTVYVDTPLTAGTYYYRLSGMAWDAAEGAEEAEVSGTAT